MHRGPHHWRLGGLGAAAARDGAPPGARVILKFGGSLLARPRWPDELEALLSALGRPTTVVVGGGAIVEGLRELDAVAPRPAPLMHWLAIDCMGITARLVASAVGLPLVAEPTGVGRAEVLDAPAWLRAAARAERLPEDWHVTSDSIATLVAIEHAATLVLAKATPPPCPADIAGLAARGWVDGHFPLVAADVAALGWAVPTPVAGQRVAGFDTAPLYSPPP